MSRVFIRGCAFGMSTSLLAIAAPAFGQDAPAQPAAASSDEIVVTAQKRQERLRDVPVSVTALSTEALSEQNLVQIRDYYSRVPGLAINGGANEQRAAGISLRGVTAGLAGASTVAFTIDDVPVTSATAAAQSALPDLDPADIERIEVLRGPQGTLYGASSLGGLIKYVTAPANTRDFSARLEAGGSAIAHGDLGYALRGSVNAPIVEDRVGLRVSGFMREDPAYIDYIHPKRTERDGNRNRAEGGRAALTLVPVDGLTVNLSAMTQRRRFEGSPSIFVQPNFDPKPLSPISGREWVSDVGPTSRFVRFTQYQARVEGDLGFADLSSISAWGQSRSASTVDVSAQFAFIYPFYGLSASNGSVSIVNADRSNRFSQEVRLASKPGQALEWLIGGFYTNERINVQQILTVEGNGSSADALASDGPTKLVEKAVFGSLTYHFTERLDVQVGGRYSKYRQSGGGSTIIDASAVPVFGPSGIDPDTRDTSNATTWLITPRYRFSDDLMAYIRVGKGYRIGGTNGVLPTIPATFGSDTVISYELGLKGAVPSVELSFDLAVFQVDWDDIQLAATDTVSRFNYLINGSTARSRGAELAVQWRPADQLVIDANASIIDAKLTDDIPTIVGSTTPFGFDGDRLPGSARFSGSLSIQKDWSISNDVSFFAGGNLSYIGARLGEFAIASPTTPRVRLPDYAMVDLRTGIYNDDWSLTFNLRNLFDARAPIEATTNGGLTPLRAVFVQPRSISATIVRKF